MWPNGVGSQTREYREQLRPFFVFVCAQRVATGRNESQRVATGVQLLAFCLLSPSRSESQRAATGVNVLVVTCEVPAAASRSGASRKSKCWGFTCVLRVYLQSLSRGESQRGLTGLQVLGFVGDLVTPMTLGTTGLSQLYDSP